MNKPNVPQPEQNQRPPFHFARTMRHLMVPLALLADPALSPGALLLWGQILALSNERGHCWASNDYLAAILHVSERQIVRYCRTLEVEGYLVTEQRAGKTPKRWLTIHPRLDGARAGVTETSGGGDINVRGGVTDMSPKKLSLGSKSRIGVDRFQSESTDQEQRGSGLRSAASLINPSFEATAAHPAEGAPRASAGPGPRQFADIYREPVRAAVEANNRFKLTLELEAKLASKAWHYGANGWQVAAAIERAWKGIQQKPDAWPKRATWFLAVVENAFRKRAIEQRAARARS